MARPPTLAVSSWPQQLSRCSACGDIGAPTSPACKQVQALEVSRATLEAQGAKGVALAEGFNAAKKKLTAAKREATKAANSLVEGERKRNTLKDTLTALEQRLAASNEVQSSLSWAVWDCLKLYSGPRTHLARLQGLTTSSVSRVFECLLCAAQGQCDRSACLDWRCLWVAGR